MNRLGLIKIIEKALIERRHFIETYPSRRGRKGQNLPPIPKLPDYIADCILAEFVITTRI